MDTVTHFAGELLTQPSPAAGSRDRDARILRDLDIAPDAHVESKAMALQMTASRAGRPQCRWRMNSSGTGLTMDWVDPQA